MLNSLTSWALAKVPMSSVPDPEPQAPPGIEDKVNTVLGFILYLVIAACVVGVLIVAAKMALAWRRGELAEQMGGLFGVAGACVLAGAASGLVTFLM
jgi:hypothetical protein